MKKEVSVNKQSIGIDVGKDNFYACFKVKYSDGRVVIKGTKLFTNNRKGFEDFMIWSNKRNKTQEIELVFLMEATGVYYEELAYFLYAKEKTVSVQLAQKIKYFAKSINLKTKTDKVDSKMIAEIAIEKDIEKLSRWTPPSKEFKMIRDLAREHTAMKKAKTVAQSQLHAKLYAHDTLQDVIELKQKQI